MDTRDVLSRSTNPTDEPLGARSEGQAPTSRNGSDRFDDAAALRDRARSGQDVGHASLDVRTARVDAVRSKLADGTFSVDAERIARSLLEQGVVRF